MTSLVLDTLIGLLPVVGLLVALVLLDSYKLVAMRIVLVVLACGVAAAVVSYFVNGFLIGRFGFNLVAYGRNVAPLVEETAKALVVVWLIRTHRVGFLVDAAILGFAVGTGFAIVENLQYQHLVPDAGIGTWIV